MAPSLPSLARRLASYSAAASVTLGLAPVGGAQVVTVDLDPDRTISVGSSLGLDVDDDGTDDFRLLVVSGGTNTQARVALFGGTAAGRTGVLGAYAAAFGDPIVADASALDEGSSVAPAGSFLPYGVLGSVFDGRPYGDLLGRAGTVGFRFVAGEGTTHYGWARIAVAADATAATLLEVAYEASPSRGIAAGDRGARATAGEADGLAEGYAFSPVAPNPVAGRARFDVTVARTEAVRVEVFDALGRSVRLVHDGPLAGGHARTFAVAADGLPTGVYVVRVTGETFDATRTVTVAR